MHMCVRLCVHVCETVFFVLFSACDSLVICLVPCSTNWLIQLFQISHVEEASSCERWLHHLPQHWLVPFNAALKPSCVNLCIGVKKSAQVIIIVCMISRTTVIYCGGSLTAHPPLFNFHSCTLSLPLTLHGPSSPVWIRNVNDHPQGQKEKVTHFHAMLNMQISRQISGSCSQQADNYLDSSMGVVVGTYFWE